MSPLAGMFLLWEKHPDCQGRVFSNEINMSWAQIQDQENDMGRQCSSSLQILCRLCPKQGPLTVGTCQMKNLLGDLFTLSAFFLRLNLKPGPPSCEDQPESCPSVSRKEGRKKYIYKRIQRRIRRGQAQFCSLLSQKRLFGTVSELSGRKRKPPCSKQITILL